MQNFIQKIAQRTDLAKTPGISFTGLKACLNSLSENNIAPIPAEYQRFLLYFNGLSYQGSYLGGIYPQSDTLTDLLCLNKKIHHPLSHDLIILGFNEMDYLGYNHKWQVYQLIDKQDLEVLEEYAEIEPALNHLLKI